MCFNKGIACALAIALAALAGCGLKLGEGAPKQNGPNFSGQGYSCIGQIPQHFENFVADELNEQQISDFMFCLQRAFTTFGQLTHGKEAESYAPEEIRRFLQTYFFKERPITQELTHEFMVLKQVVIGGSAESITKAELADFIKLLEELRVEAVRLKPHLKYLNSRLIQVQVAKAQQDREDDPKALGENLARANDALRSSIRVVSSRLERGKRDYTFENFETLIREFRNFARWDESVKGAISERYWVDFIREFKKTTVSPNDPELIHPGQWSAMLQNLSRWYLAYIQYQAGVKGQQLLYGAGLQNTMHLAEELFQLSKEAVSRQGGTLSTDQIGKVITAAQNLQWIPSNVRHESVEHVLHALLERVFAKKGGKKPQQDGLTEDNLNIMRKEFHRWAQLQLRLISNFNMARIERENSKPRTPSLAASFFVPVDMKAGLSGVSDADWEHFLEIKDSKLRARPLFNDNLSRVTLVPEQDLKQFKLFYEFNNLSMMNLFRTMVGVLFRGYASESTSHLDWGAGLKREELQQFYMDIRDIAVDLGFADKRVTDTGRRAFIEGNLFTYAAEGLADDISKSRLSFVETMELLAFLYSGSRTATDFYNQLRGVEESAGGQPAKPGLCQKGGGLDQYGQPKLDRDCVTRNLGKLIVEYGVNMPGMNHYMSNAPEPERDLVVKNIMDSAFSPENCKTDRIPVDECAKWVEYNELSIMAVVLHYLEAVLTKFDTNGDGILVNDEVRRAVPVFAGYFQDFARTRMNQNLTEREAAGAFLYILKYKKIPSMWSIITIYDMSFDQQWEYTIGGYKFRLDFNRSMQINRAELSSVFKVIVAKIFDTKPVAESQSRGPAPAPCQDAAGANLPTCTSP